MIRAAAFGVIAALAPSAFAQTPPLREAVVVYLELAGDARHEPVTIGRLTLEERPRPWAGVSLAFADARTTAQAAGVSLKLERVTAIDAEGLLNSAREAGERGVRHIIIDAPGDALRKAQGATGQSAMLYNVSAGDDELRGAACAPHVTHVTPSDAMGADALAQFLISRKWRTALALQGPAPRDAVRTDAFVKAFTKFGGRIVARKTFVIGSDPRAREQNDPALITAGGPDHDVVFVADVSTEFARELAYRTARPRPIVGDAGLRPLTWSWTWDRYGAPQLNVRFARANGGRHMEDADWTGWMAGRMIAEAEARGGPDVSRQRAIVQDSRFDGVKGVAVSVRRWDGQLRQPILLATDTAVVASAPLPGFLHATDTLDSLGADVQESACQQRK